MLDECVDPSCHISNRATALACKLFREKRVQKEYLAVVRGHLPLHPDDLAVTSGRHAKKCARAKMGLLINDTEEFERLRCQHKGSQAHQKQREYPRGPRQGTAFFHMDQAQLRKEGKERELSDDERELLTLRWQELTKDRQQEYTERAKADKARFLAEFAVFLGQEKAKLAKKRKYGSLDHGDGDEERAQSEPVAYVFDDPIVEPKGGDVFRMEIGDSSKFDGGKASTTIAFVLGHAAYDGEPVTKVLLRPLSGRRHQLRLHLAHNGFPIVGDVTYGSQADNAPRMMLHAWKLWLRAPPEAQVGDRMLWGLDETASNALCTQEKYGELFFTSPDPFDDVVPTQREITTLTYHRDKLKKSSKSDKQQAANEQ